MSDERVVLWRWKLNSEGEVDTSEPFQIPNMSEDDSITYIHGLMFESDWCPGTPHIIEIEGALGWETAYSYDWME